MMKTNYRRKRTKARQDHRAGYYGNTKDFKRDSTRLERRAAMPTEDDEDERPKKSISWWSYD
jgi:hypothetical protein